jgi:hypothetical protein
MHGPAKGKPRLFRSEERQKKQRARVVNTACASSLRKEISFARFRFLWQFKEERKKGCL